MTRYICTRCSRKRSHPFDARYRECPRCGRRDALEQIGPCGRTTPVVVPREPRVRRPRYASGSTRPGVRVHRSAWQRAELAARWEGD